MREVKPGSIQETVVAAYKAAGGLECVADDLGVSISLLSRAVDASDEQRPGGLGVNYLHRMARVVPVAAVPIAHHFAGLAGGEFVPIPPSPGPDCLVEHGGRLAKESGEAIQAILKVSGSRGFRQNAIKELKDLEDAAKSARQRLEAGQ